MTTILQDLAEVVRLLDELTDETAESEYKACRFVRRHAATIEQAVRDAEIGRYFVKCAEWIRDEDDTLMAIRMPGKPDLSCLAFRRDAIKAAMAKESGNG
jgi:hypothetical protein